MEPHNELGAMLRALDPQTFFAAKENLRRYIELAIEIARTKGDSSGDLTHPESGGSVSVGVVDPSTSKKNG
jgi:hypothetical protein